MRDAVLVQALCMHSTQACAHMLAATHTLGAPVSACPCLLCTPCHHPPPPPPPGAESARRSHPTNLVLLFAFTAAEALLVATASSVYNTDIVLLAAGLTAAITLGLTAFALQTKRDFTASGGLLVTLLLALLGAGLLSALLPASKGLSIAVAALGAGVFGAYIVFDVQVRLPGCRAVSRCYKARCERCSRPLVHEAYMPVLRCAGAHISLCHPRARLRMRTHVMHAHAHMPAAAAARLSRAQLMLGGGAYSIGADEYVFAALTIYLVSAVRRRCSISVRRSLPLCACVRVRVQP